MTVQQNKELIKKYNDVLKEHSDEIIKVSPGMSTKECLNRIMYLHIYGHTPLKTFTMFQLKSNDEITFTDRSKEYTDLRDKYFLSKKKVSFFDTCYKLGVEAYPISQEGLYITDIGMVALATSGRRIGDTQLLALTEAIIYADNGEDAMKLADTIIENMVIIDINNDNVTRYLWVKMGYSGLMTNELEFKRFDIDLDTNYNDDIPYDDILRLIKSPKNELILLDGKPGTGKTSLIKNLMGKTEKPFLYIDSSLLAGLESSKFIDFLLDYRNSVVVLEDCEKILSHREEGNPFMGTLLNLTDGIIGETVKAKFICSFNCPEHKIDKALLRKGRLSLKYTFNELSLEKTKNLMPEATKPLTLAEIYHKDQTNVVGEPVKRKIGF